MPQNTNLNISPYFDDFNESKNFHRVLFNPGNSVQARELTTLQSILQNQIERHGKYSFKDGTKVIPGNFTYLNNTPCILLNSTFLGLEVSTYLSNLVGKKIRGAATGVTAKVIFSLTKENSELNADTLYFNYISSGNNGETSQFLEGEEIIVLDEVVLEDGSILSASTPIAKIQNELSVTKGSLFSIDEGIYFVRGFFVRNNSETIILDQYGTTPTYQVGFQVDEEIVSAQNDETLYDNAQGFSNYTAPGADRLKISIVLSKVAVSSSGVSTSTSSISLNPNFVEVARINGGVLVPVAQTDPFKPIRDLIEQVISDQSGDFVVDPFKTSVKNTLSDFNIEGGAYNSSSLTASGTTPSDDLLTINIGPGVAYVAGKRIEKLDNTLIDIQKPRTKKTVQSTSLNFEFGNRLKINNIHKEPTLFETLDLRNKRIVTDGTESGTKIGTAKVYDFYADELYSSDNSSFSVKLLDIQVYTFLTLSSSVTLGDGSLIEGSTSGAKGYLVGAASNVSTLVLSDVVGTFSQDERILVNGVDKTEIILDIIDYDFGDVKSLYSPTTDFTADCWLFDDENANYLDAAGATFNISGYPNLILDRGVLSTTTKSHTVGSAITSYHVVGITTLLSSVSVASTGAIIGSASTLTIDGYLLINNEMIGIGTWFPGQTDITFDTTRTFAGITTSHAIGSVVYKLTPATNLVTLQTPLTVSNSKTIATVSGVSTIGSFDIIQINGEFLKVSGASTSNSIAYSSKTVFEKVKVGDLISYTKPNSDLLSINRVISIDSTSTQVTLESTENYPNLIDGTIPTTNITATDFFLRKSFLFDNDKNYLMTRLPRKSISDFSGTNIYFRKQYSVTGITGGTSPAITDSDPNIYFLPFSASRYTLTYDDGTVENLRTENVSITNGSQTLTLLTTDQDGNATLTATVKRLNPSSKNKVLKRCQKITISNTSGVAGNGLLNSSVYGTRIEDKEISLNYPDIVRVREIIESNDSNNPDLPKLTLINATDTNFIVGEKIQGKTSNALGVVVSVVSSNPLTLEIARLNNINFKTTEGIVTKESNILAEVSSYTTGDKNIANNYRLDNGQRSEFYDFGRIIRSTNNSIPSRKITIVYDRYDVLTDDTGNLLSSTSYLGKDYCEDIPVFANNKLSDLIDFRPRVSPYNTASSNSPFESASRSLVTTNTIVSQEPIDFNYQYYLGRLDKLILKSDGSFEILEGTPSESYFQPVLPPDVLEIATINYEPYTCNVENDVDIIYNNVKNFTMEEIGDLERRVDNLEEYTSLSLLESNTSNLTIVDEATGLNKFKSGFFVDNFTNHNAHDLTYSRLSIDSRSGILKPSVYRKQISLTPTSNFNVSSLNSSVVMSGDRSILTLGYSKQNYTSQIYASTKRSISPTTNSTFVGNITLSPLRDVRVSKGTFSVSKSQKAAYNDFLNRFFSSNDGLVSADYDAIFGEDSYGGTYISALSGSNTALPPISPVLETETINGLKNTNNFTIANVKNSSDLYTITSVATQTTQLGKKTKTTNLNLTSRTISWYMRSRNVTFRATGLMPYQQYEIYFDNVNVTPYCTPKLLEIQMIQGVFNPSDLKAQIVVGSSTEVQLDRYSKNNATIKFKILNQNHRSDVGAGTSYTYNPYSYFENNSVVPVPNTYSTTSTLLNVDLDSLALYPDETFDERKDGGLAGWVGTGMYLTAGGKNPAKAIIRNVRFVSDAEGNLQGSFWIPPAGIKGLPFFESGTKSFELRTKGKVRGQDGYSEARTTFQSVEIKEVSAKSTTVRVINDANTSSNTVSSNDPFAFTTSSDVGNSTPRPLAQSFRVVEPAGVFLTDVDLFFADAPTSINTTVFNAPVTIEIRPMTNGVIEESPSGSGIIEGSRVTLPYSEIKFNSTTGNTPTRFSFGRPIFLEGGGKTYAICIATNESSFKLWTATVGSVAVGVTPQTIINEQPSVGFLFTSQLGDTWIPVQNEDLKFTLVRAEFDSSGSCNLYNSSLSNFVLEGSNELDENPIDTFTREVDIILNTGIDAGVVGVVTVGAAVSQMTSGASGIIKNTSGIVSVGSTNSLVVSKIASNLSPAIGIATFNNVSFTPVTGIGSGLTGTVTIVNGKITDNPVVSAGGSNFNIGDVLRISTNLGENLSGNIDGLYTVGIISAISGFRLRNVQGDFDTTNDLKIGVTTITSGTNIVSDPENSISVLHDGTYMRINQRNHGMHSKLNVVRITDVVSDSRRTELSSGITSTSTSIVIPTNAGIYTSFENLPVSGTNPGYLKINEELVSYTSAVLATSDPEQGGTISGITRGIDDTPISSHNAGSSVMKYELCGISLRRINTQHSLSDVDSSIKNDLDYYYIKINRNASKSAVGSGTTISLGTNRTGSGTLSSLYINRDGSFGGEVAQSSTNVQFEEINPKVNTQKPNGTTISSRMRTVSATSVSGSEVSYQDQGFSSVSLNTVNTFTSPRLIASNINETQHLEEIPNQKSVTLQMTLATSNTQVSPIVYVDNAVLETVSYRINSPLYSADIDTLNQNYINDSRVNSTTFDPHSFIYQSNTVLLSVPASSIRVQFDAFRPVGADIRCLYRTYRFDSPEDPSQVFNLFNTNGLSDTNIPPNTDNQNYSEYIFNVNDLPKFSKFEIKLICSGVDQANPIKIRNLRVVALA